MADPVDRASTTGVMPPRACERIIATTSDGLRIAIQKWGCDIGDRDLIFIHGYSQSHLCWNAQLVDPNLGAFGIITYDLRGHGESDKPDDPTAYRTTRLWADELQAVIAASGARNPVVLAWSYAGRVLLDYVTFYGTAGLTGIVLIDATSCGDPGCYGSAVSGLAAMHKDCLDLNVEATISFWETCTAEPLPEEITRIMIASNMVVPPYVRRHLSGRPVDYEEACKKIAVPTLVVHGALDAINTVAMARYSADKIDSAKLIVYGHTGHAPFLERPRRFGQDIAAFVASLPLLG